MFFWALWKKIDFPQMFFTGKIWNTILDLTPYRNIFLTINNKSGPITIYCLKKTLSESTINS